MIASVFVSGRQLLKHVHVAKLQIIMFVHMIGKSDKKPVLVEVIINNLFPEIDMHFIVDNK